MAIEFTAFEKAQEELGVTADQLKKLISSGGIRAFSDGGTFKFRRQDLDAYKSKQQTILTPAPPPVPAEPAPIESVPEEIPELSLDEMELVQEPPPPPPEPKKPASSAPTLSTEELKIEEIDLAGLPETQPAGLESMPEAEVLSLEGDLDVLQEDARTDATQPIGIEGDALPSAPDMGTVSMEVPADLGAGDDFGIPAGRARGLDVRSEGEPAWAALVAATFAVLVFAGVAMTAVVKDRPVGFLDAFSNFLVDKPAGK